MLALTREMLNSHLQKMSGLIDLYERRDSLFIHNTVTWLADLEKILQQTRNPLVSFVAVERGKVLAITDGYRDPSIPENHTTKRKAGFVSTMMVLGRVEAGLLKMLDDIDTKFGIWREKMAQFIAVATNSHPIALPPTEPHQTWLEEVWGTFSVTAETQSMYNYLNTVMDKSDKLYLLGELLDNILGL